MSSKLLLPDSSVQVQSIEWRTVGAAPQPSKSKASAFSPPSPQQHAAPSTSDAAQVLVAQQHRIHELEQSLEQRVREAYQQGNNAGVTAGVEQAQHELEPVMARLARAAEEIAGLRRKVRTEVEEDAVRLAVAVARKVLHREITVDPDALLGLVKAAMQRVDAREIHRIRAHPEDIPALERHIQGARIPSKLEVIADPSLERGGVIFETTRGNLDASTGTQFAEIERGFIDIVRRSRDAV